MAAISAAIRNAVGEKTAEIQRLADQLEDILYQAGLAQRRGSHKDSRCEDIKNICGTFRSNRSGSENLTLAI